MYAEAERTQTGRHVQGPGRDHRVQNRRRDERAADSLAAAIGAGLLTAGLAGLARRRIALGGALAASGAAVTALAKRDLRQRLVSDTPFAKGVGDRSPLTREVHVRRSITINAPAQELYDRWRRLEDLPLAMSHLEHVEQLEGRRSRWTARGPMGRGVQWEAEITEEQPGKVLSWRSVSGAAVETRGRVEFQEQPAGRGTIIRVDLHYRPAGGAIGAAAAKLFGADPADEITGDLRRFKQLIESGEIATSATQADEGFGRANAAFEPTRGATTPHRREGGRAGDRSVDRVAEASEESFPASDAPGW